MGLNFGSILDIWNYCVG